MMEGWSDNVLIIKLGALGDFVQALSPMAAIRKHHPSAKITLLTTAPYEELARASGYVDDVWLDQRPKWYQPVRWLSLRNRLRSGQFKRVYDLQTSDRSSSYFKLFRPGPRPEWSGIARGCSHPHANPRRDDLHTVERQAEQLAMTGITNTPPADLSWIAGDIGKFGLEGEFCLFIPGGAAHRPDKRWPQKKYAELANLISTQGITPVFLGGKDERPMIDELCSADDGFINLAGQTEITDIGALARKARFAIGNDTGPMHLISAVGCPSVVLYSQASDPALCGQRGANVKILRVQDLMTLSVEDVASVIKSGETE